MRIRAGLLIALLATAAPAFADPAAKGSFEDGLRAYNEKLFAEARNTWNALAREGDAEALLGLGRMSDTGVGGEQPDAAAAYGWYLRSARAGHPEAQFTVSQRLEDAHGVKRDLVQAAIWCARAAAKGHPQAQYRLGQLYETGQAAPRNLRLAAAWYRAAAASSPEAARRLATLGTAGIEENGHLIPPVAAEALVVVRDSEQATVELVWTSPPQPQAAQFFVQIRRLTGEDRGDTFTDFLEQSATTAALPAEPADYAWRVLAVDPRERRYVAGDWSRFSLRLKPGETLDEETAPLDVLAEHSAVIRYAAQDDPAQEFARDLAADFTLSGMTVVEQPMEGPLTDQSEVRYFYPQDGEMADAMAQMLPGLERASPAPPGEPVEPPAPGAVEVRLRGGHAPSPE